MTLNAVLLSCLPLPGSFLYQKYQIFDTVQEWRTEAGVADFRERVHRGRKSVGPWGTPPSFLHVFRVVYWTDSALRCWQRSFRLEATDSGGPVAPESTWQPRGLRGSIPQHTYTCSWSAIWRTGVFMRASPKLHPSTQGPVLRGHRAPDPWGLYVGNLFPVPSAFTEEDWWDIGDIIWPVLKETPYVKYPPWCLTSNRHSLNAAFLPSFLSGILYSFCLFSGKKNATFVLESSAV